MDKPVFLSLEDTDLCEQALTLLESKFQVVKINDMENYKNLVSVIYVRFSRQIDEEVLSQFPDCKYVVCNATNVSHIDVEACAARGIEVISVQGQVDMLESVSATAEFTWLLLMSLARNITSATSSVAKGEWNRDRFMGLQLRGRHIGIVGYGRNGKKISRYASAFEMSVSIYDPYITAETNIQKHESLQDLCAVSDFVCITATSSDETQRLFDVETLRSLRSSAFLINTARGEIVDEQAVIDLVRQGSFAGYATDVVCDEKEYQTNIVVCASKTMSNIIVTPHIGGVTTESWGITERFVAQRLLSRFDERHQFR